MEVFTQAGMETIDLIISYVSIWAPSLVAVLGVVILIIRGIFYIRQFIESFKTAEITQELRDINNDLKVVVSENKELKRVQAILIDKITRIKDYVDNIDNTPKE